MPLPHLGLLRDPSVGSKYCTPVIKALFPLNVTALHATPEYRLLEEHVNCLLEVNRWAE